MSMQVPASFQTKYKNNVEMVLGQTQPMLKNAVVVTHDASADKIKVKDLVGHARPARANERHGDTKYANTPHDGVWLGKPDEAYYAELLDRSDKLATSLELGSTYVQTGAATVNRSFDMAVLAGAYGSIVSGKEGTSVTPFPSGQIVPVTVGGASGAQRMNVAKLRAANMMLAKGFVDLKEQKFMALTAEQSDDLLSEVPATSADFKGSFHGEVDENGFIQRLLGWNFIPIELSNPLLVDEYIDVPALSLDGSGYRKTPFWVKSGIVANYWEELKTSIDILPGKVLSTQFFAGTTVAATRTQAGKVGMILNSEAA